MKKALCLGLALCGIAAMASDWSWQRNPYLALNVVPYSPGCEAQAAADARAYVERTGDDIVLYSLTLHPEGRPARNKLMRCLESYRAFVRELEGSKVKPGILIQAVLGHWPRVDKDEEPWTRSVDVFGEKVRYCPEDSGFKAYIFKIGQEVAKAHPSFVLTDDDIRAYSHEPECFCPRHVADLNRRLGTSYDEARARAALTACRVGDRTYEAFIAMQREMIDNVARTLRAGFDSVDPMLPCGASMPGEEPRWAARTARIVAARGQAPVLRVCNAAYNEGAPKTMYRNVMQTFAKSSLCGEGIRLIEEADTFPQNRWSKSAVSFYSKSVIGIMCGLTGAKRWYVGAHFNDGTPVDEAYLKILERHRGQLPALAEAVKGTHSGGLALPLVRRFVAWHPVTNRTELGCAETSAVEDWIGPFGLPFYATESLSDDAIYVLSGREQTERFSDQELQSLLGGRVFVDGQAALAISRRGFDDLLGVEASSCGFRYNGEVTAGGDPLPFPKTAGTPFLKARPGAEILSHLVYRPFAGAEPEVVSVGSVSFCNRLNGRVVVTAFHADVPWYNRITVRRKRFLVKALGKLGFDGPFAEADQHVLTLVRESADGSRLVSVTNLGYDLLESVRLHLPTNAGRVERMDLHGKWCPDGDVCLSVHETAVFRVSRGGE